MTNQKQAKAVEKGEYIIGIALVLSALLVSLTLYLSANSLQQGVNRLGANLAAQPAAMANIPAKPSAIAYEKEVTMDFLYADWCPHCNNMKPVVAKLLQDMPKDRFTVRYYRDEDSQTNATVASVYSKYSDDGFFSGYPTFVINGADYKAGEMPESEFRAWVCGKFASPKPSAC